MSGENSNGTVPSEDRNGILKSPKYDEQLPPTESVPTFAKKRKERTKLKRTQRKLNKLLHTHVALILVCVLSTLDAACVIGQIICDILIMSDELYEYDQLHVKTVDILIDLVPDHLNRTVHKDWSLESIVTHLEEARNHANGHAKSNSTTGHSNHDTGIHGNDYGGGETDHGAVHGASLYQKSFSEKKLSRNRRAAGGGGDGHDHADHSLLDELTHTFHLASMVILSVLMLETFFKIFAMGKHFLNHKLEMFDAFVVTVSWCLDVAFWEGIWHKPGTEGATILIIILPWRVCRIVNSFVLVIQEKDLVVLKVVKQRLRAALRREKDISSKLDRYRLEVRQLQGLCRKSGADEVAIQACCPAGRRRRSSLFQSLTSLASLAMVSAMGSAPELNHHSSDSSDQETESSPSKDSFSRRMSLDSTLSSPVTFSLSPDAIETPRTGGVDNAVFRFDSEAVNNLSGKKKEMECKTRL